MVHGNADRRRAGASTSGLLVVLVILVGAGGFNYYRNFQAEQRMPRPYRSYSDSQLTALISAYKQDVKGLEAHQPKGRLTVGHTGQLLDERVAAFTRIQRAGDAQRRAEAQVAGQQGVLGQLEQEQATRQRLGKGLTLQLHRLFTL